MGGLRLQKIDRNVAPEALNQLLSRLDSDPEQAGERYEFIHSELVKYFECRGCFTPRDLADETINRVARKIMEGEEISSEAFSSYFYGVARNVLREYVRSPERKTSSIDSLPISEHPLENPSELALRRLEKRKLEQRLECLESCIKELPPETQRLIISYYEGEEGVKIDNRKQLAEELGIPLNNLRIRIHRVREKLEKCVINCLNPVIDN
jgi:RNA polymerase sigma factor (sigma-70 family)